MSSELDPKEVELARWGDVSGLNGGIDCGPFFSLYLSFSRCCYLVVLSRLNLCFFFLPGC